MEILSNTQTVEVSGVARTRAYTANQGRQMMQVLSDMYKNREYAMVREYLSNIIDAYTALKRQNPNAPFVEPIVGAPSDLDPSLTFTDFGVGMDRDMVWDTYFTYFASTKTGSNDEIGGFGLGAKVAHAYNDGKTPWSIESRHNGIKTLYMTYIGESGIPEGSEVSSGPTTEPNGVTVKIPILKKDFAAVRAAIQELIPFFTLPVKVLGMDIKPNKYMAEGNGWKLMEPSTARLNQASKDQFTVVMGNVPYKVDARDIGSTGMSRLTQNVMDSLVLFVPVGGVDIVPSRDSLKFTEKTKNAIAASMRNFTAEYVEILKKNILSLTNPWDVAKELNKLQFLAGTQYATIVHTTPRYSGRTIRARESFIDLSTIRKTHNIKTFCVSKDPVKFALVDTKNEIVLDTEQREQVAVVIVDSIGHRDMVSLSNKAARKSGLLSLTKSGRISKWQSGYECHVVFVEGSNLSKTDVSDIMYGLPASFIWNEAEITATTGKAPRQKKLPVTHYTYVAPASSGAGRWVAQTTAIPQNYNFYVPLVRGVRGMMPEFGGGLGTTTNDIRSIMTAIRGYENFVGIPIDQLSNHPTMKPLITRVVEIEEQKVSDSIKSIIANSAGMISGKTFALKMILDEIPNHLSQGEVDFLTTLDYTAKSNMSNATFEDKAAKLRMLSSKKYGEQQNKYNDAVKTANAKKSEADSMCEKILTKYPILRILVEMSAETTYILRKKVLEQVEKNPEMLFASVSHPTRSIVAQQAVSKPIF